MALVGVVALVLSIILTVHALAGMNLIGCAAGSSCDQVTGSRWSLLLGFLPISSLAVGAYLAQLLCVIYLFWDFDPLVRKTLQGLSACIFFCCLWFIYLQAFQIKAFCPYCMSAHLCGLALSVLAWLSTRDLRKKAAVIGTIVAAAFMVFQGFTTPSYRAVSGVASAQLPVPQAFEAPVVGPVDAPQQVALLYDYRCSHCRIIHGLLEEAVKHFEGKVCFVLCPTPLSPQCNPYIPAGTEDRFPGSCELARLALDLWKSSPEAFRQFDAWLFEADAQTGWYPRSPEEALAKARELGGGREENAAWVQDYLNRTLELFGRTTAQGRSGIPRLAAGTSWLIPEADTAEGFIAAVEELLKPVS